MPTHSLRPALLGLTAYRQLLETEVLSTALALLTAMHQGEGETALSHYTKLFYSLKNTGYCGIGDWLWDALRYGDSPYPRQIEASITDEMLASSASRDVTALIQLAKLDCTHIQTKLAPLLGDEFYDTISSLPCWSNDVLFTFTDLTAFYQEHGYGDFAKYRTFVWEQGVLIPIAHPDCPRPEELMGYSLQRNQVYDNTRSMMAGNRTNNVLLFGNGGTGKSATVKSMLYQDGFSQLRLIEIAKEGLTNLPALIRKLGTRRQKFILFIDDLAFDLDDKVYSSLKSILEGGLEPRPKNVAVYATSNRRHLVRQTFTDRAGEEVDTFETISEKTALAERFGLRIPYLNMNKAEYLALVSHLTALAGIEKEESLLHAQAMTWEIRHGGRTPRTAKQFIHSLHI